MDNKHLNKLFQKRFFLCVYFLALFGMLHSTIIVPAHEITAFIFSDAYPRLNENDIRKSGVIESPSLSDNNTDASRNEMIESGPVLHGKRPQADELLTGGEETARAGKEVYSSDLAFGSIGVNPDCPIDSPYDNLFKVFLKNEIEDVDLVYLNYEVFGVENAEGISRSINNRPSTGGFIIKHSSDWVTISEEISSEWLRQGENTVLFTSGPASDELYKIRNLSIEVIKSEPGSVNQCLVIQNHVPLLAKDGIVYIKGFLKNATSDAVIEIGETLLEVKEGEFEGSIPLERIHPDVTTLTVKARDAKGILGQIILPVEKTFEADAIAQFERASEPVSTTFSPNSLPSYLESKGASIVLPDSCLLNDTKISIRELRKQDVPPLGSGMVNVTKGEGAYRFTPDGMKFSKPARICLAYDTKLIPAGFSSGDVKTFYFNTVSKKWEVVQTDTVDVVSQTVTSLTDHFTDYVNGIIQTPENPQTSGFTSTMMSDIKAADPSANITIISPPDASQTGDANLSYPIKIPAGRKGMQPQLAIQYSSGGGDSWTGMGWNLSLPGISIDSRWGVPTFGDKNSDGDYDDSGENIETEIYTLEGEQLMYPKRETSEGFVDWMPNRQFDAATGVVSTEDRARIDPSSAFFTLRKQGSFARIQRLGSSPSTYYWKVTETDGTIKWYGGKTASDVANSLAVSKNPHGDIVYWALFMVEDVYGNNVKYSYETDLFPTTTGANANLSGGRMFYPTQIVYTGQNSTAGNYKIEFIRSDEVKSDVTLSARMGFKQVDPYLLERINVKYQNQLVRYYTLDYVTGRFNKTLLQKISEFDKDGNLFYDHTFDYYDDLMQNGQIVYFSGPEIHNICPDKCYEVSFPVPFDDQCLVYENNVSSTFIYALQPGYCEYINTREQIYSVKLDGIEYSALDRNIQLTHFNGTDFENLCPQSYLPPSTPYYGIQAPFFESDMEMWLYTELSGSVNPFDINATNQSYYLYVGSGEDRLDWHYLSYSCSFYTPSVISGRFYSRILPINYPPLGELNPSPPITSTLVEVPTGITSEIIVSTNNGNHNFGYYNLSDPYYVEKFQSDFITQYPGTPLPTVTNSNGTINIYIPNTTAGLIFNSITLTGGGISNTYNFNLCGDNISDNENKGWGNAVAVQKDIEYALNKKIADGNELDKPIDDVPVQLIVSVSAESVSASPLKKYTLANDTINWGDYYDFSLAEGSYMLTIAKDSSSWQDSKGNRINDFKALNVLNGLLDSDQSTLYKKLQEQHREEVMKTRRQAMEKAKEKLKESRGEAIQTVEINTSGSNQLRKLLNKGKNKKATYIDNLTGRYKTNFQSTQGPTDDDDDCGTLTNNSFLIQTILPSFNSAASMLGSTEGKNFSIGGYLGLGIGWNHSTKLTTFGVQYNKGWNSADARLNMVDIDGDGLDDIVIKDGDQLYYKKHLVTRSYSNDNNPVIRHSFSSNRTISGITNFFKQNGTSSSWNFQATFGVSAVGGFAGTDHASSKSENTIYFTDANGDGLIDIVKNGTVFFNRLINGIPYFEADSRFTENMVITAAPRDINTPAEYIQNEINYPNNDVVKVWEAPADGEIQIENNVELSDESKEAIISIEMKGNEISVCKSVQFPTPSTITDYYYYYPTQFGNFYMDGNCSFPGGIERIVKLFYNGNEILPNTNLLLTHCLNGIPTNLCPTSSITAIWPDIDPITQNENFENEFKNFLISALSNIATWGIDISNLSGLCQYSDQDPSIINYSQLSTTFYSLDDVALSYQYEILDNNFLPFASNVMPIPYMEISTNQPVPVEVTIATSNGNFLLGTYDLTQPSGILALESDLHILFPEATSVVTATNGDIQITIQNATTLIISVTLTGGGVTNSYNFANCELGDNSTILSIDDWINAKVPEEEKLKAVKKSIANGELLTLPVPDAEISFLIPRNNNPDNTYKHYLANISDKGVFWKYSNGENISNNRIIDSLNALYPDLRGDFYKKIKASQYEKVMKSRIEERDRMKGEINDKPLVRKVMNRSLKTLNTDEISECSPNENSQCLLFGAVLNQNQRTVSNILTNFNSDCVSNETPIYVKKGDRIYFRIHNVSNGNPPVNWNPKVEYTNPSLAAVTDQNGLTPFSSQYSDGFILSSESGFIFPGDGTATITWDPVQVNSLTDKVTFEIVKAEFTGSSQEPSSQTIVYTHVCNAGTTQTVDATNLSPVLVSGNLATPQVTTVFYFKLKANSNVNWKQIDWRPKIVSTVTTEIIGSDGEPEGTLTTDQTDYPAVNYDIYKSFPCSTPYTLYDLESSGAPYSISPSLSGIFNSTDEGIIQFVVKGNNALIGSREITVSAGTVSIEPSGSISIPTGCAEIEIGFYTDDSKLDQSSSSILAKLAIASGAVANLYTGSSTIAILSNEVNLFQKPNQRFGPMLRQWGQFMYNPDAVEDALPLGTLPGYLIKEEALEATEAQATSVNQAVTNLQNAGYGQVNLDDPAALENFENSFNQFQSSTSSLLNIAMVSAHPSRTFMDGEYTEKWVGFHDECYTSALSSRAAGYIQAFEGFINEDDETVQDVINTGAYGLTKYSINTGRNVSAGVNIGVGSASFGITGSKSLDGQNISLTDYTDMNGDRYPDLVSTQEAQMTNRTGGLFSVVNRNTSIAGSVLSSESSSWGGGATGSFSGGGKSGGGAKGECPKFDIPRLDIPSGNSSIGLSGNFSSGSDNTSRTWADINGDGLSDLLIRSEDHVAVKLNYGNNVFGSGQEQNWGDFYLINGSSTSLGAGAGYSYASGSAEAGVSVSNSTSSSEYMVADINGDGLMDVIRSTDDKIHVTLNNGASFGNEISDYADFTLKSNAASVSASANIGASISWITPIFFVPLKFPCINVNSQYMTSTNKTLKSIADFDGDGFPDLQEELNSTIVKVWYSNIRRTNKLKTVHNPLGGEFTIDYRVADKDYNSPHAKWVMNEVVINDGYDFSNDGEDAYRKNFEYENGKYDRRERQFYGFETVKTIDYVKDDNDRDVLYRVAVSKYLNNSYFLNGMLYESYVYKGKEADRMFSKQVNSYELKALTDDNLHIDLSSTLPLTYDVGGSEGRRSAIALLYETTTSVYEFGTTPVVSKVTMEYDEKGRVSSFTNHGDVSVAGDNYLSEITYHDIATLEAKNVINIPESITVTDDDGNILRQRNTTDIDPQTGAIGKIIASIDSDGNTAETDLDYDTYGNLYKVILPSNSNSQRMQYQWTYDATNHKYVNTVTDAFGYTTSNLYNANFDALTQTTDMCGNVVQYYYDSFGRLVRIVGPKEAQNTPDPYTISFEYFPLYANLDNSPSYAGCISSTSFTPVAVTKHYDGQNPTNPVETITFIDGLARPVQVKKDVEINLNPDRHGTPVYTEMMSVSGKVSFDLFGRAVEQRHPVWEKKECSFSLRVNNDDSEYSSTIEYDEMDRPVRNIDPDGNFTTISYGITTGMLTTHSETDQNGVQTLVSESQKDALGNVVRTINAGPAGDVITSFVYNAIGELMSYTDADNLSSVYAYDRLGRKISFLHPDNGLTSYTYDDAGNLIYLQTANLAANNQFISYSYDYNRLTAVTYPPVGGSVNISNVTYEYGVTGSGNMTGRLVSLTDATGTRSFKYGSMGELVLESRVVVAPTPLLPNRTFSTSYTYDSWNRLLNLEYPDGEIVSFGYDKGGNLKSISGTLNGSPYDYLKRVDYDHYEQPTFLRYGNNTETFYNYTPSMRRLQTLVIKASTLQDMVNNVYAYDKVGNITSLTNQATYSTSNGMGGNISNNYIYDVLNRLTGASGLFAGDRVTQPPLGNDFYAAYNLTMSYSNTGRIDTKNQWHELNGSVEAANTYQHTYSYVSGSHKIEQITDENQNREVYSYDSNGNLDSWEDANNRRFLFWDEANRLRVISNNRFMLHYFYDASGERTMKATGAYNAVYINGQLINNNITMGGYTTYPNGFITVNANGLYTKHYYMGTQRIASRIGDGTAAIFETKSSDAQDLKKQQQDDLLGYANLTGVKQVTYNAIPDYSETKGDEVDVSIYYYHPDHLGSNTFISDMAGLPYQMFVNLPFGETMAEQTSTGAFQNVYKFNGKELDAESGLYYYGARYYDPRSSVWLSVDPLMEKWRRLSPYNYGGNNPLRFIDPDGNGIWDIINGSVRGVADNMLGTNTRASYKPDDSDDYNNALDRADRTCIVAGAAMVVGGTSAAIGGSVAAPVSGGSTLVVSAVGLGVAAEGSLMLVNGVKNLSKGNHYGENPELTSSAQNSSRAEGGTVWKAKDKSGGRIDWEKPGGNNQKGQVHYQSGKNKYIYDSKSNQFLGKDPKTGKWDAKAPRSVQDLLKNRDVQNAIKKGQTYIGS